ncbi:MAG: hypothetical protein GXP61_09105, partial [Epsilonproteobacteria bacterium]|nr:hypothetical protein [Campylobacterota bacterium]
MAGQNVQEINKRDYKKILSRVVIVSLLLASSAMANIVINDANTTGVTSAGDENITVTNTGSITIDANSTQPID